MTEKINMETVGAFIRQERKKQSLTQKDLGEAVGVSDKAVSKWERGLSFPDITLLSALADVLDVSIVELIQGERFQEDKVDVNSIKEVVNMTVSYSDKSYQEKSRKIITIIMLLVAVISSVTCLIVNLAVTSSVIGSLSYRCLCASFCNITSYSIYKGQENGIYLSHWRNCYHRIFITNTIVN